MRRTKEDAEKTRADILNAAEQLFAARGVQAASLDQIARAAGVTRGAVYWHFKDKPDVLRALRDRYRPPEVEIMATALEAGLDDVLEVIAAQTRPCLVAFAAEESRQRMFQILEQTPAGQGPGPDTIGYALMIQLMTRAQENGHLAGDLTPGQAALSLSALFRGLLAEWLMAERAFDLPEVGTRLIARHLQSLRQTPGA